MPAQFHCTLCQNLSRQHSSLADPRRGGRQVTVFECSACGKIDLFVDDVADRSAPSRVRSAGSR